MVKALSEFRWDEGLRGIETALRLNPASALVHFWHARVLKALGRNEESFSAAFRAVELDPLSTLFHYYCAQFCLSIGQPERALEHAGHALEIDPNSAMSRLALGEAHSLLGRHDEGIAWIEKALSVVPGTFVAEGYLAWAYVRGGRRADAERFRADLDEKSRRQYMPPGALALVAAALGDVQSAFRLVEEGIRLRDPNLNTLIRSPYFQQLQSDPRYPGLLRSMNLQP
jgi:adenylate cyclase